MKCVFVLVVCFTVFSSQAQDTSAAWVPDTTLGYVEPSKESQAYHQYRIFESKPCYPLTRVKTLIKTQTKKSDEDSRAMKTAAYNQLSLREKWLYTLVYPEDYSQNCDAMMPIADEHKKIFADIPYTFDEYVWSKRQQSFLQANRDSVMAFIKHCVGKTNRIGVNYKMMLLRIQAVELIPWLIQVYNIQKKDHDILTLLLQFMKEANYTPFIESAGYKKLYGPDAVWPAYLNANKANIDLILKRATAFYESRK
jgi:hypothetical protein